jgi:deazaflavin-dependent oxidoreductase (nitroreductase family)
LRSTTSQGNDVPDEQRLQTPSRTVTTDYHRLISLAHTRDARNAVIGRGVLRLMSEWNDKVIADFRANGGRVGGNFAGAPLLLLHSIGARTAAERVSPMMYQKVGNDWAVFASYAGKDINPSWYHNLKVNPDATIEVGADTVSVTARELTVDERTPIWEEQKRRYPGFADYEAMTKRTIPVMLLTRR